MVKGFFRPYRGHSTMKGYDVALVFQAGSAEVRLKP